MANALVVDVAVMKLLVLVWLIVPVEDPVFVGAKVPVLVPVPVWVPVAVLVAVADAEGVGRVAPQFPQFTGAPFTLMDKTASHTGEVPRLM